MADVAKLIYNLGTWMTMADLWQLKLEYCQHLPLGREFEGGSIYTMAVNL